MRSREAAINLSVLFGADKTVLGTPAGWGPKAIAYFALMVGPPKVTVMVKKKDRKEDWHVVFSKLR